MKQHATAVTVPRTLVYSRCATDRPSSSGNAMPMLLEALASPLDQPGLPMGGRRALSFSDSRQGTARLAAKLQQEAERTLSRAFLYHAAQEDRGPEGEERARLERRLALYQTDPAEYAEDIRRIRSELAGAAKPVLWVGLVERLSQQAELRDFACEVWRERAGGGREMAGDPQKLAAMFLYRELFRRPKVQNNPETMGLLRLAFPRLEERARGTVPGALREAGVDAEGWIGLALAAVDFGFRDNLAVDISPDWMVRWMHPVADGYARFVHRASRRRIAQKASGPGPAQSRSSAIRHACTV